MIIPELQLKQNVFDSHIKSQEPKYKIYFSSMKKEEEEEKLRIIEGKVLKLKQK